jgi:hypothetical protein
MSKLIRNWFLTSGLALASACADGDRDTAGASDTRASDTMGGANSTAGADTLGSAETVGAGPDESIGGTSGDGAGGAHGIDSEVDAAGAGGAMNGPGGKGGMPATPAPDDPMMPAEEPVLAAFRANVYPIFAAHCGPCHLRGGHADADINVAYANVTSSDQRGMKMFRILDRIGPDEPQFGGRMPPSCMGPPGSESCLTADDYATLRDWYDEWLAVEDRE